MEVRAISRVDVRGIFRQELTGNGKVENALARTFEHAAHHAVSVLDATGDISTAIGSLGFDYANDLEIAVLNVIGGRPLSRTVLVDAVLRVVSSGSITGIPTAMCLHSHLPPFREPTPQEIEEAWEKCCRAVQGQ
jgi:hypothetical protein